MMKRNILLLSLLSVLLSLVRGGGGGQQLQGTGGATFPHPDGGSRRNTKEDHEENYDDDDGVVGRRRRRRRRETKYYYPRRRRLQRDYCNCPVCEAPTTITSRDNDDHGNNNNNNNNNNNAGGGDAPTTAPTPTATTTTGGGRGRGGAGDAVMTEPGLEPITVQILVLDSQGIIDMVAWNAADYERHTAGRVKIVIKKTPTMPELFEEIENDARTGGGLFDAYYTNPIILGTAAILGGFMDLTSAVKENPLADWTDVLLALRTYVTSFEDKIYIILLDGDTHTMFYRKDVLEAFHLPVPRTWNEYIRVAAAVHGKSMNNVTLSGSCVSRIKGDHAMYWSHLVLSTITQTQGTASGSLFDTKDMTPLTGHAVVEMLRVLQGQAKYGTDDEFDSAINAVQNGHMNDGSCAMTFMWGDMFRRSKAEGSVLHDKLGIAPTPGSEVVLNRETGNLERCTRTTCPYAKYYDDIGFVNSAPYAANGGWGAAISANTEPAKQKALTDFFLWASSREQSQQYVIPNATLPISKINGQDPWRKSQLDVDKWVEAGFDRELSRQYVESLNNNLISKNVVIEVRFPKAGEVMSVLDEEVNKYLVRAVKHELIPEHMLEAERLRTAQAITEQWNQIIKAYNARGDTVVPILETYQRLRGVFVASEQKHHLTYVRPVGLTLMSIVIFLALAAATWIAVMRKTFVVQVSQPTFLGLICLGTAVMGSSILPMGIDDSIASQRGCSIACMATPWLVAIGFAICFAALFSKIYRLNTLMRSARQFQRIQVTVLDVFLPFAVLLLFNVAFLLVWTLVDPLYWERVDLGRTGKGDLESYGRCISKGKTSFVMLALIVAVNITAVILANIQAYLTRNLEVACDESKYIALCMASILQAFLIGLPLLFLVDTNPAARYVVRSVLAFVICMSILVFIYAPKMLKGFTASECNSDATRTTLRESRRNNAICVRRLAEAGDDDYLPPSCSLHAHKHASQLLAANVPESTEEDVLAFVAESNFEDEEQEEQEQDQEQEQEQEEEEDSSARCEEEEEETTMLAYCKDADFSKGRCCEDGTSNEKRRHDHAVEDQQRAQEQQKPATADE